MVKEENVSLTIASSTRKGEAASLKGFVFYVKGKVDISGEGTKL